jgi:hypothetical protein
MKTSTLTIDYGVERIVEKDAVIAELKERKKREKRKKEKKALPTLD